MEALEPTPEQNQTEGSFDDEIHEGAGLHAVDNSGQHPFARSQLRNTNPSELPPHFRRCRK
jgi:hypothetical protein